MKAQTKSQYLNQCLVLRTWTLFPGGGWAYPVLLGGGEDVAEPGGGRDDLTVPALASTTPPSSALVLLVTVLFSTILLGEMDTVRSGLQGPAVSLNLSSSSSL